MTDRERIVKLETTMDSIKDNVSEMKDILIAHVEREDNWRDKADRAYAGKWTEAVLIGASTILLVEAVIFVFKVVMV